MTNSSRNGPAPDENRAEPGERPGADFEQTAEQWAERIGVWILRTAARAKEEAEDIWADAQALRREL